MNNNNNNLNKIINNNIIINGNSNNNNNNNSNNNGFDNIKLNFNPSPPSSSSSSPSSSPILPNLKNSNLLSLSKESPILLIIHSAQSPISNSTNSTPNSNLSPCLQSSVQQQLNTSGFQQLTLLNAEDQKSFLNSFQKNNSIINFTSSSDLINQFQVITPSSSSLNSSSNNLNQFFQNSNIPIPKKNPSQLITSRSLLCKTPDCIVCENGPPPSLDRGQIPIWAQILHVALFALTESSKISQAKLQSNGEKTNFPNGKRYFHLRDDIYEFINVHWDIICKRERIQNWKHTIGMTLSHYQNLFQNGYPIFQNTGYWCLKDDAPNPYTTDFMDSSRKRKYSKKNQQQNNTLNINNSNSNDSPQSYNNSQINNVNNNFSNINNMCNSKNNNNNNNNNIFYNDKSKNRFGNGSSNILNDYNEEENDSNFNWSNKRLNTSNSSFFPNFINNNVNNNNSSSSSFSLSNINNINNNNNNQNNQNHNNNKISIGGLLC